MPKANLNILLDPIMHRLTGAADAYDPLLDLVGLEPGVAWKKGEAPETFPSGL